MHQRLSIVVLVVSMFLAQGCAATCDDVCDHIAGCSEDFGVTVTESDLTSCVSSCERGICGSGASEEKNQAAKECVVETECGSGTTDLATRIINCAFSNCL